MFYKNSKLGNFLHYNHPAAEARFAGFEQIPVGFQQIQVGQNEDGSPIYGDGDTIYEDGDPLFLLVGWNEAWGEPPTDEELEAWEEPEPEPPPPVTDLDRITKILAGHEAEAPQRITRLKAEVSLAMIAYAGFNPTSANAEGSRFVVHHAAKIAAFNLAGGNVVAGRALYDTIAESTGDFAWLNQEMGEGGPSILSIFAARLVAQ